MKIVVAFDKASAISTNPTEFRAGRVLYAAECLKKKKRLKRRLPVAGIFLFNLFFFSSVQWVECEFGVTYIYMKEETEKWKACCVRVVCL